MNKGYIILVEGSWIETQDYNMWPSTTFTNNKSKAKIYFSRKEAEQESKHWKDSTVEEVK